MTNTAIYKDAQDMTARLLAWYQREQAVVSNERMPEHWRRQSMEAMQEIENVLGYKPEVEANDG